MAEQAAKRIAIRKAFRCRAFFGFLSRPRAWIPATANPVAVKEASAMWRPWGQAMGLNMAFQGSMFSAWPWTQSKPVGLFIQALAQMTKKAEARPLIPTMKPLNQWA